MQLISLLNSDTQSDSERTAKKMRFVEKLPTVEEMQERYPLTPEQSAGRERLTSEIKDILSGKDSRKLIFAGPCSADREDAVLEYAGRLAGLADKVKDKLLIVPRIYSSKPRTSGMGYKGILHRPISADKKDDLYSGLAATRKMHLRVVQETGLYGIDEMLYPDAMYYYLDLLASVAVGARSVENQEHRLLASGLDIPVGMKNPISGDFDVMLNAILAAQHEQSFIYRDWVVGTEGNPYAFAILRGKSDSAGASVPNYHYEDICRLYDRYCIFNLRNMAVIVDCNHSNSGKRYEQQIRIAKDVFSNCRAQAEINSFVKGIMIESYLEDGSQMIGNGIYGKSITDPCLGWEKTERLLLELADLCN